MSDPPTQIKLFGLQLHWREY